MCGNKPWVCWTGGAERKAGEGSSLTWEPSLRSKPKVGVIARTCGAGVHRLEGWLLETRPDDGLY